MKNSFNLKSVYRVALVALCLLTIGVGDAWGGNSASNAHIYFNNTNSQWNTSGDYKINVLIGRQSDWGGGNGLGGQAFAMSLVPNTTNLYYKHFDTWENYDSFLFNNTSLEWPTDWVVENPRTRAQYGVNYSGDYEVDMTQTHIFTPASSSKGASLSYATGATYAKLNSSQSVEQYLSTNGASSYSAYTTTDLATITISTYKMDGDNSTTESSVTMESGEGSCDAALTATVIMEVTNVADGYEFVGWYDGDTEKETATSYSYEADGVKSIRARFVTKFTASTLYLRAGTNWQTEGGRFAACFKNHSGTELWVNTSGTGEFSSVSVPDGNWNYVIMCRMNGGTADNTWSNRWDQTSNMCPDGVNNCIYIADNEWGNTSGGVGAWTSYAPIPSISGTMNNWEPAANQFSGSPLRLTMNLPAGKAYNFKVADGLFSNWYGHGASNNNDLTFAGQANAETLTRGHRNMMLLTAQAGTYTFEWDATNEELTITYPETEHPSLDYVYMEKYSGWNSGDFSNIHYWDDSSNPLTAGSDDPKMTAYNYFTDKSLNYYIYPILADYPNFKAADGLNGGTGSNHTDDMTATGHEGHYVYYDTPLGKWTWGTFTVRIQLNDLSATTTVVPTYQDVAFNSAVLTDLTSVPEKDHYDFGGFYTGYNALADEVTGDQVIDKDGHWLASVADYTDASKHWIHAGTSTTLYAKWTEIKHDVTVAVSPDGAGSVQISGSPITELENIGYVTHSAEMTAVPTNAAWVFKEWQVTSNAHLDLGGGYSTTGTTMKITATGDDQTLTAVFEPRFTLVGSKAADGNPAGGMPGWDDYDATREFTVNSIDPVNLTKECILEANTLYKFQIHDRIDGNFGDGTDGKYELIEANTAHCSNSNKDMLFQSTGAGTYIFKITAIDGSNRASVQLLWPHQTNFGRRRVDIDGTAHDDNTGGTLAVTSGGEAISTGSWHTYGTNIAYDADNATGYQLAWYTSSEYSSTFDAGGEWNHDLTSNDNCYAQFTELATPVTLSNDGHGKVQISSEDATSTTCGITTTRSLAAVANTGYVFSSWSKSGDDINLSTTAATPTTLSSLGGGVGEGQSVTANFSAKTYSIKLNNDHGGEDSEDGTATATYDATSLSSVTDAQFSGWTLLGYWNSDAVQVVNANGSLRANVDGYTDSDSKWTNDAGSTVNLWAHWSRSITLDDNGDYDGNGAVTVSYNSTAGTPTITTTPTRSDYAVEGYYTNAACTTKVMEPSGKLIASVSGYTDSNGKWTKKDATTLYTKWIYVIYRTGDSSGDSHKSVYHESYAGGTIPTEIEFRMKVHELNNWYSLCLPFTVTAVKVWDEEDGRYYDLVPYYRPEVGGTLCQGHYHIRTPKQTTDFLISEFSDWRDPSTYSFVPAKNTPYIIRWHDEYFKDRYVSFFSATGETIPKAMSAPGNPAENSVNVCVNQSMTDGSVAGAYMLENDYGNGAWLRLDNVETLRTIPPFECYIVGASGVVAGFPRLRGDMTVDNNATGWETIDHPAEETSKILIDGQLYIVRGGKLYTVQGMIAK